MDDRLRIFVAELIGTAVLVMGGVGSAVLATTDPLSIGTFGVAFAFGLALLIMVYAIGSISGCHVNPAVTAGLWALRRVRSADVPLYWLAQLAGAAVGGVLIFAVANGLEGFDSTNNFAQNGWSEHSPGGYGLGAAAVVEIVFTALLVFVVASTSHSKFPAAGSGIAIGLTLALIHLATIPVDNTSVNPARSFASALFAGADAWQQFWAFVVFPLIGGVIGAGLWSIVREPRAATT